MRDLIQTSEISGKAPSWLQQVWVNKNAIKMLFCLFQWNNFLNKKIAFKWKTAFYNSKIVLGPLVFIYVLFFFGRAG